MTLSRSFTPYDASMREESWPFEMIAALREDLGALRAGVEHVGTEQERLRADFRRLDDRLFHVMLAVLATLATTIGSLVATLAA